MGFEEREDVKKPLDAQSHALTTEELKTAYGHDEDGTKTNN